MPAKYIIAAELMKKRILNGDYALKNLPSVRELARELDISYVTAQRAYVELERLAAVVRRPTGRLEINRQQSPHVQVAFLTPTFHSLNLDIWRNAIDMAVSARGGQVRPVLYTHWDDPHLTDVLDSFDGIFLAPLPSVIPANVLPQLQRAGRLVILEENLSHIGIPSLTLLPPVFVQTMLDHLDTRGHRHIDCFNVQPMNPIIEQRIEQWQLWMSAHHYHGHLINTPVAVHTSAYAQAYQTIAEGLRAGTLTATALFCTSLPAAVGANRALYEQGIRAGAEIALCSIDGEGVAPYTIPSLTTLDAPDAAPFLHRCLDWMEDPHADWVGPLWMHPRDPLVIARESTAGEMCK